jgi:hypothetical protein
MPTKPEPTRQRRHDRGLTLAQQRAVELLILGQSDTQVAEQVGVARETVCRWRSYSPTFQAELNVRRSAVFQASVDKLRSMTQRALTLLETELDAADSANRMKVAAEVLKLAQLTGVASCIGNQDAEDIVRRKVEDERRKSRGSFDDLVEQDKRLPPFDEHMAQKWEALETLANGEGAGSTVD